jgi:hypothetical protein
MQRELPPNKSLQLTFDPLPIFASAKRMGADLSLTNFCLHLSPLLLEAFACGLLPHTCARKSQQQS